MILFEILGNGSLCTTAWLFWLSARSEPIVDQVPVEGR